MKNYTVDNFEGRWAKKRQLYFFRFMKDQYTRLSFFWILNGEYCSTNVQVNRVRTDSLIVLSSSHWHGNYIICHNGSIKKSPITSQINDIIADVNVGQCWAPFWLSKWPPYKPCALRSVLSPQQFRREVTTSIIYNVEANAGVQNWLGQIRLS